MEVLNKEEQGGPSSNNIGGKRRRFVISQQPIGTAMKASEQRNSNNLTNLYLEVKQIKTTLEMFSEKLDSMEMKMNCVLEKCSEVIERVVTLDQISQLIRSSERTRATTTSSKSVLFNSQVMKQPINPHLKVTNTSVHHSNEALSTISRGFTESSQIIRLNSEGDYPDGSWLGDPCLVEERVRVKINELEMDNLNTHCTTPEKMALTLLESLFSRDTLAQSNLTGRGKHKKKQLDPLLIFGIFCHLKYMFNIQETDWSRIKNNMDAKCRFFWSRKCKGLPLGGNRNEREADEGGRLEQQEGTEVQTQYPSYSMYSVLDEQGQARLVTVGGEGESVYQLDTGEFVTEVQGQEQFGDEGELGEDSLICGTVLVSSGGDIMLGGAGET